ncbi:MAG: hypothetical protein M1839_004928 [Geoglossum umbratile]|nr:MAG: hypothetical protein M1839_004928 [Geoglossum umbratile]
MHRLFRRGKSPAGKTPDDSSVPATASTSTFVSNSSVKSFPLGIKLLYKSVNSIVDIIFIHGRTGHREKTWRMKNATDPWPQTLLPAEVSNARILTFGYDAYAADWRGMVAQNGIGNHSMNLLTAVATYREDDDTALISSQQRPDRHLRNILESTRGIVFLGTPHHGSGLARWAEMLAKSIGLIKQTNPQILQVLQRDSEVLARIQDNFHVMVRARNQQGFRPIEIACFYEELPLPGIGSVVPLDSAILPGYTQIGIHSNHMDMTKFEDRNDPGFKAIAGELRRWVKELGQSKISSSGETASANAANTSLPKSPFKTPFPRDSMFIGREDIMARIDKIYKQAESWNHTRLALVGLGGVGKSQTAIEYAYRVRDSALHTSVFWIHASNAARFEQGYREIANEVELPGRDDPRTDILRLVSEWLSDEKNGRWLIILDNADDDNVLFGLNMITEQSIQSNDVASRKMPLASFIPQTPNGSILATSRDSTTAMNLVGYDNVIPVEPMNEGDALALLKTRVPFGETSESEAKALIQALEYIPLAITHAAAYIRMREPRVTISTYLQLFHESVENQSNLLSNRDVRDLRRDYSMRYAVITAWQISFNQIQETRPAATDLLALISMFDRQGIPEYLLRGNTDQLQFEDAIAPLISFALIRAQVGRQSFEMHSLVQLSMRKWLEQNMQLQKWRKESVRIMAKAFPSGEYKTWTDCQVLLPHSKEVMTYVLNDVDEVLNRATIADHTALYLFHQGKYASAEKISRDAVEGRGKVLGPEHPDTLTSIGNLGSVLESLGRYGEAEAMHRRVLEGREKVLGPEHPDTLTSISHLGSALESLGRYGAAEAMHRRALEGREKVLGPEQPDTLTSISHLGSALESLGRYGAAEAMHRRALEGREKVLGPEHPDTLTSISHLGSALENLGRYGEAEAMHRRALEGKEKVLGPEHPNTLISVSNLGSALQRLGKYEEAEAMHRRDLEGSEKVLGPEHPETLASVNNLGSVLKSLGKYEEVEAMYRRNLTGSEKVLGQEHPDTLTCIGNLGSVLESLGRYEEAEAMHRRALEGRKRVLGPEHPYTLTSVSHLGSALERLGKYEEAEAMYRRDLEGSEKVLGPEHPETLASVSNLGSVLKSLGKYEEAEAMYRRGLEGLEKVLGPEHPETLANVSNLGSALKNLGRYEEAGALHRRALEGRERVLGPEHPNTLISVSHLGSVLNSLGKYEEAEAMYRRGLEGLEKVLGPEHPDTLICIGNLGSVLKSLGRYEEAGALHRRALEGRERVLGPEHPNTLISVSHLGSVLKSLGKYEEAEAMYRRDLEGSEKVLGPEHPDTLVSVNNLGSVLESSGRYEEAEAMHRRALEGRERVLGPEHPYTLTSVSHLGSALERLGKYEEAEAMYRRGLEGLGKVLGPEHPDTLTSASKLGSVSKS